MAELVGDNALQFITVQFVERAAGDGHSRVKKRVTCGKCIDVVFGVHDVNQGNRNARGDGHFLHNIEQTPLVGIICVGFDFPAAEHFGDGGPSPLQQVCFINARAENDDDDKQAREEKKCRVEKLHTGRCGLPCLRDRVECCGGMKLEKYKPYKPESGRRGGNDRRHCRRKQKHLEAAVFTGPRLSGKEIVLAGHERHVLESTRAAVK